MLLITYVSQNHHGRPQEFLQKGAKSTLSLSFPSLSSPLSLLPLFPSLPLSPLPHPLHFSLSSPLRSCPKTQLGGLAERCMGLVTIAISVYFEPVKRIFDFGSFCANQNVVTEANLYSLYQYIFQGTASARSCPCLRASMCIITALQRIAFLCLRMLCAAEAIQCVFTYVLMPRANVAIFSLSSSHEY